ncbi:hypothetical protein VTL71DRAFT_11728 [Oculimacula yallundae]|uniref:Peptidase A1 domain-containing protein n=1 Tax=Oculimacula yallundae TaxID=86028 RepID=A0ABR4CR98_9HELO
MEKGVTPSNTFGLHIGAVNPRIKGSLLFGGYDQARICGNISTQRGGFDGLEPVDDGEKGLINLLDIGIVSYDGISPFSTSRMGGLLAAGNSSIGASLSLPLFPEAPYLNLPKSRCDAIAAWLPVTYNANLGLYTWNTNNPQYSRIISSTTVLRTPYFPCNAQSRGKYSLGRAFLQAAFVGANWNVNNNQGVWWLAQAPGPNVGSQSTVKTIKGQDTVITSSSNDWVASWEGILVPLNKQLQPTTKTGDGSDSSPFSPADRNDTTGSSEGLSVGAKAGIGIGAAAVLLGFGCLFVFIWHKKRKERRGSQEDAIMPDTRVSNMESVPAPGGHYRTG